MLSLPAGFARAGEMDEQTWSGTVTVDEALDVPAGSTLRIEAGTTVEIAEDVSLRISGRLLAEGTEAEPIRLTHQVGGGPWGHLLFVDAEDSLLRHCVIEHGGEEGDHKDYYDDRDADCEPATDRPPRSYHEAVVVLASHVDIESCVFQNLPEPGGEGDALAVISDDPEYPGEATANVRGCEFLSIGQGIHTRYSYVLVEDCFFTGHRGDNDDVDLYGESTPPPMIRSNEFIDPRHDDMINPTRCSARIIGNVIAGSDDHGLVLRDLSEPVVMNNIIFDCSSAGIAVQNQCDALIVNNTIAGCGRGIRFFDHTGRWDRPYCLVPGSGKATVWNCIIWDCPTPFELEDSPYEEDPTAHATIRHCIVQGGEEDGVSLLGDEASVTWGESNLDAAPLFVDLEGGDLRLQEGSPAIDAGSADPAPDVDIAGAVRPCGAGVDLGAYEAGDCEPPAGPLFRRGDSNGDGLVDVSDPVTTLLHLFRGEEGISCEKSADADDSGDLDLTDAVYGLEYLFANGTAPPDPGAACGADPTEDSLSCTAYERCN